MIVILRSQTKVNIHVPFKKEMSSQHIFSAPELNAQVHFCDRPLSVVWLIIFSHF